MKYHPRTSVQLLSSKQLKKREAVLTTDLVECEWAGAIESGSKKSYKITDGGTDGWTDG